ncbi:PREDICTED: myristoylated alanine-rich C-kinase substrate-like [Priapulus caudatus]|uniref:Myristoylated alanine-rich C-kinase substrate-like n=1 Tax=Priapulus caudatus TaxID=37621 RepID=A0ABM1FC05_PRICU|nr:PREDICTED: myristoylated alanine-rich C-kinase substrate-like [Priapulus caudatus]
MSEYQTSSREADAHTVAAETSSREADAHTVAAETAVELDAITVEMRDTSPFRRDDGKRQHVQQQDRSDAGAGAAAAGRASPPFSRADECRRNLRGMRGEHGRPAGDRPRSEDLVLISMPDPPAAAAAANKSLPTIDEPGRAAETAPGGRRPAAAVAAPPGSKEELSQSDEGVLTQDTSQEDLLPGDRQHPPATTADSEDSSGILDDADDADFSAENQLMVRSSALEPGSPGSVAAAMIAIGAQREMHKAIAGKLESPDVAAATPAKPGKSHQGARTGLSRMKQNIRSVFGGSAKPKPREGATADDSDDSQADDAAVADAASPPEGAPLILHPGDAMAHRLKATKARRGDTCAACRRAVVAGSKAYKCAACKDVYHARCTPVAPCPKHARDSGAPREKPAAAAASQQPDVALSHRPVLHARHEGLARKSDIGNPRTEWTSVGTFRVYQEPLSVLSIAKPPLNPELRQNSVKTLRIFPTDIPLKQNKYPEISVIG